MLTLHIFEDMFTGGFHDITEGTNPDVALWDSIRVKAGIQLLALGRPTSHRCLTGGSPCPDREGMTTSVLLRVCLGETTADFQLFSIHIPTFN
jgi:hypothetical protein